MTLELARIFKGTLTLALIVFTGSMGTVTFSMSAGWATSIGVLESSQPNGFGEILEPSASQPSPTSALEILSGSSGGGNDNILGTPGSAPQLSPTIAGITQIPDFTDFLTALEWVRQWADTGYWLETDQWTDFQAIAVAGYSPEIRYWLGRDRWASFGAMPFGITPDGASSNVPPSPDDSPTIYPTDTSAIGGITDHTYEGVYSRDGTARPGSRNGETAPVTIFDLIVSMLKKVARQPIFYLIFFSGVGLLIWAFRRQASA